MKLFSLILILSGMTATSFAQKPSTRLEVSECPIENKWRIEFYIKPFFLGFKGAPTEIISIVNPQFKDGKFNNLELLNSSGKIIKAVKIKWFLYQVKRMNNEIVLHKKPTIIIQQETPSIETNELKPGERREIDFPLGLSCQEIFEAVVKNGEPKSELWMEHIVSEIIYTDGSYWAHRN